MKKLVFLTTPLILIITVSTVLAVPHIKEPLERVTFIHFRDGKIKTIEAPAKAATCYKLLGVKWYNLPISYVVDPKIDLSAITASTREWDDHTSANLFDGYTTDNSANFDDSPDGRNEYSYGNYPQSGVIAVTRIWYTRRSKQIVEYDVLFDSDFVWGNADKDPSVMDWQNIATHETGHGLGLGDVYNSICSYVTMYGYSTEGETIKRTLEQPDITGLQKIYGA